VLEEAQDAAHLAIAAVGQVKARVAGATWLQPRGNMRKPASSFALWATTPACKRRSATRR
jgi:hypothetical protein